MGNRLVVPFGLPTSLRQAILGALAIDATMAVAVPVGQRLEHGATSVSNISINAALENGINFVVNAYDESAGARILA
jgi:hypothetical protein